MFAFILPLILVGGASYCDLNERFWAGDNNNNNNNKDFDARFNIHNSQDISLFGILCIE
jgi:hypothetical protein